MSKARYRISKHSFVILLLALLQSSALKAAEQDCFAELNGESLKIGNPLVSLDFAWHGGDPELLRITDSANGDAIAFTGEGGFLQIDSLTGVVDSSDFSTELIPETEISYGYLKAEVHSRYAKLETRRVFKIYPGAAFIVCDLFIRLKQSQAVDFSPENVKMFSAGIPGNHWKYRSVEFFDRTDRNNNLVKESDILGFTSAARMRGNILYARDLQKGFGFFVLKEAPCSFVQLHYPGYDFICSKDEITVSGLGLSPDDLSDDEWIQGYSLVLGPAGVTEEDFLFTLRRYQKHLRKILPGRDEMVMMNTWGDRNRDASIDQQFVKAEIDACKRLGVSHFQIDDGWQQGLSRNSSNTSGKLWDQWGKTDWQPSTEKFPAGFDTVTRYARQNDIQLGLWFHPSNANSYANWRQDADIIAGLYRDYGVRYFKIDGIKLPDKRSEINCRAMFDQALMATDNQIVFNLDATADNRGGSFYFYKYGNIFLENRYTDWVKYYPYWTLRNLWMLSKYVAPERMQIEFLNKWRNADKYPEDDPFAPSKIPFDYQFAITMMAQPLAWFEGTGLPDAALAIADLISAYRKIQHDIHSGIILPVGNEPSGRSWTGFQSIDGDSGYFLVFRENNDTASATIPTYLPGAREVECRFVLGHGENFTQVTGKDGRLQFQLDDRHSFVLYHYTLKK
jgi:hypothetical protein